MKLFKPSDFMGVEEADEAAWLANTRLSEIVELWPVVYGIGLDNYWSSHKNRGNSDLEARLAFIKKIEDKPCRHIPIKLNTYNTAVCGNCNEEIVATWRTK